MRSARDASGHVAAAPPSSVMNSRLLLRNSIRKTPVESMIAVSSIRVRSAHGNSFDHLVGAQQECLWDREPERLDSRQICVLPGTELAFAEEVKCAPFSLINWTVKTIESRTAIFRQVNKDIPRVHHDALEFANGTHVLLTDLLDGQEATVLPLPAQPKTPAEEAAQRRVACVG